MSFGLLKTVHQRLLKKVLNQFRDKISMTYVSFGSYMKYYFDFFYFKFSFP